MCNFLSQTVHISVISAKTEAKLQSHTIKVSNIYLKILKKKNWISGLDWKGYEIEQCSRPTCDKFESNWFKIKKSFIKKTSTGISNNWQDYFYLYIIEPFSIQNQNISRDRGQSRQPKINQLKFSDFRRGNHGRDRMVVRFTTTYANQCLSQTKVVSSNPTHGEVYSK